MHPKLAVGALAAVLTTASVGLGVAPAALATTVPVPLSFNHAVLDTPGTKDAQIVSASTSPLTMTADVDTSTGAFTIDPSTFSSPTYHFTSPVPGTATLSLAQTATGQVDFLTGQVTMTADFLATLNLGAEGSCVVSTGNQTLSTGATEPLLGTPFPAGATGVATGDGALGVHWSTLPASSNGTACAIINSVIDGPGGVWISRGISPSAAMAPSLSLSPATKSTSVVAGKKAKVAVVLTNAGGADTKSVRVCLSAKRPVSTSACQLVKAPKADSRHKLVFTVSTTKATKPGTYALKVSASGATAKSSKLKVTRG